MATRGLGKTPASQVQAQWTRYKMKFIKTGVDQVKKGIDQMNKVTGAVQRQAAAFFGLLELEAPWVFALGWSFFSIWVPLIIFPYIRPLFVKDSRQEAEEERVRLCLQKGIDPYPYLTHRDTYFGVIAPFGVTDDKMVPNNIEEFELTLKRFQTRKEEAYRQHDEKEKEALKVEEEKLNWFQRLTMYRTTRPERVAEKEQIRRELAQGEEAIAVSPSKRKWFSRGVGVNDTIGSN
jgi:hypothetical protein